MDTSQKIVPSQLLVAQRAKGIKGVISVSNRKGKRFMIRRDGKRPIHFGAWPVQDGTFIDHKDEKKRAAWRARHSKIMVNGKPAYLDENSPAYYSWHLLW